MINSGDGTWSDANVLASDPDVTIRISPQHWLAVASGGTVQLPFRQLEVAFCSAVFFDAQAARGLLVARSALSPVKTMAGVVRAAIAAGLPSDPVAQWAASKRRCVFLSPLYAPSALRSGVTSRFPGRRTLSSFLHLLGSHPH